MPRRSWTHFRVDRRNPRYCHVTFDHPPINTIREYAAKGRNPGPASASSGASRRRMDCRLSPLAPRVLVSEYQYSDFRAIDRPLTRKEMAALRSISTRAAITAYELHEPLEWGDLKANPSSCWKSILTLLSTSRTGGRMSSIFASRRNRSTTSCSRRWSLAGTCRCEKQRDS
jgi:hypothetical protein